MPIEGLSDRRRLPRLGIIRLGLKVKNVKGIEYPKEVDYFVCPSEVQKVYGEKPKELDVMIPCENIESCFPQYYKMYGSTFGLKCRGNGKTGTRINPKTHELEDVSCVECPEKDNACKPKGQLMVILPKINLAGVYQITTSSVNGIIDVNSGIDYVRDPSRVGRIAMVPLLLRRELTETHHEGQKQTHYTLKLVLNMDVHFLNQLRGETKRVLLGPVYEPPTPDDHNPALDPVDVLEGVVDEEIPEKASTPTEAPKNAQETNVAKPTGTVMATSGQISAITKLIKGKSDPIAVTEAIVNSYKVTDWKDLTKTEAEEIIGKLQKKGGI
jgi:hypothetical protein